MARLRSLAWCLGMFLLFPLLLWSSNTWETPPEVVDSGSQFAAPQIITDTSGNSYAAWYSYSGSSPYTVVIYSSYRPYGGSWQTPVNVSGTLMGTLPTISIVADLASPPNAYVAWLYDDSTNSNKSTLQGSVIASPYTSALTPTTIDNSGFALNFNLNYNCQINSDETGVAGAIVVYEYFDSGVLSAANYSTSSGMAWAAPAHIVHDATGVIHYKNPQVATSPNGTGGMGIVYGNIFAIWIQGSASSYTAYMSQVSSYTSLASLTWLSEIQLGTTGQADSTISPTAANLTNRGGGQNSNACAAWVESPSAGMYTIYETDFEIRTLVTVDSGLTAAPTIQMAAAWEGEGTAGIVAWVNSSTDFSVYSSTTLSMGVPTTPWVQASSFGMSATIPVLAYDLGEGPDGILVWSHSGTVYGATFSYADATWSSSATLSNGGATAITPWVSAFGSRYMDAPEEGIAIWESTTGGASQIQSATLNYSAPSPPPGSGRPRAFGRPCNGR